MIKMEEENRLKETFSNYDKTILETIHIEEVQLNASITDKEVIDHKSLKLEVN